MPSPQPDALALAAHALGVEVAEVRRLLVLGGRTLPPGYAVLVDERARRVPLQHLTGHAAFRHLTLAVGPGVFVPRPGDRGARRPRSRRARPGCPSAEARRVVDLCSGSGAIPLALKDECPQAEVRGLEVSPEAWAWATANRDRLGLDVDLALGDATQPCFDDWAGAVDVVTINPPYIPVGAVPVDPEVRDHDPEIALYGGSEDGLAIPLAVVRVAAGPAAARGSRARRARRQPGREPSAAHAGDGAVDRRAGPPRPRRPSTGDDRPPVDHDRRLGFGP